MTWEKYHPYNAEEWNDFVIKNKIHFFFLRSYMDYHKDRFEDHSLILRDNNKIISIFPANKKDNKLISHGGLTFGGVYFSNEANTSVFSWIENIQRLKTYAQENNFGQIIYKPLPHIYKNQISFEEESALINEGFELFSSGLSMSLMLDNEIKLSSRRKRMIKKSKDLIFQEVEERILYPTLEKLLKEKYNVAPIHSLDELEYLKENHPNNISSFIAKDEFGNVLAGVICFNHENTVHAQYISSTDEGRSIGALDGLFNYLFDIFKNNYKVFDFGTSMNRDGSINFGLLKQKSEFGCKVTPYNYYKLDIKG